MSTQTVYNETMDSARAGGIVNTESKDLISRTVESATLGFGLPVSQGIADSGCHASTTGDTEILGISVRERSVIAEGDGFVEYDSARVMTKGVIWVVSGVAVVAGDIVHVVLASSSFAKTGGVLVPNARYDSSAAIGELVKVRLG